MSYYHQHHDGRPRRRLPVSAGQRVQGAVALLVIVGVTAGLPYALLFLAGNPLTNGVLAPANLARILTSPDDGTLLLSLLQIVGWIAWAVLALSIVVELSSQLRGVRAPSLPGLGMPQGLARGLVGAVMLLFTVMPSGNAVALESGAPSPDAAPSSSVAMTLDQGTTTPGRDAPVERADKDVVVQRGDTLWGIAEAELGDGSKYPELYEASQDVHQPGGAHLTDPDLIHPGWTIQVPGAGEVVRRDQGPKPQERPAPAPDRAPDTAAAAQIEANQAAGGAEKSQADTTADAAGRDAVTADGLAVEVPWQVTTTTGVGALLAAGVAGLIAARRRDRQRTRRPGQVLSLPPDPLAAFEHATRAGADQSSVEAIDAALRSLASFCVRSGRPLPVVRAARLTSRALELYLEAPALLPQPWTYAGDATVWTLATADAGKLGPVDRSAVPAPYPSLVTIGYDDDLGHVLLNLEHLGALGITGDIATMDEILAAVALELATSIWADELQVTVVGALAGLEPALRTGRVRSLPTAGRVIEDLMRRVEGDRAAIAAHDATDLYAARVTGAAPDTWAPEIVLLSAPVSDDERADLAALVADLPHVALATVTGGDVVGPWSLHIEEGGQAATLAPVGLRLRPQRLSASQYEQVLGLAATVEPGAVEGVPWAEPTVTEIESVAPVGEPEAVEERVAQVMVGVEGPRVEPAVEGIVPAPGAERTPTAEIPAVAGPPAGTVVGQAGPAVPADGSRTAVVHETDGAYPPAAGPPVVAPAPRGPEATFEAAHLAPRILLLGRVDVVGAQGPVDDRQKDRLLEYAAFLGLHRGSSPDEIDAAMWPGSVSGSNAAVRTSATARLRRWFGQDESGQDFLPRHQGDVVGFGPAVTTDVETWELLVERDPRRATTPNLTGALRLVRGIPFQGAHRRRFAWAEPVRERLIAEVVDASFELAKRCLLEGRWRSAEDAAAVGLRVEPAQESLWRMRILAAHQSSDPAGEAEAVERLLNITDQLECNLQPETEQLLASLKDPGADFDRLMAGSA